MKKYYNIILAMFIAVGLTSCDKDDDSLNVDLDSLEAPTKLGATFKITQDNSGLVTITPTGEGANLFTIDFGDGSTPSDPIRVGQQVQHVYAEGDYDVVITGQNLAGETSQATQPLTVSFLPPENLEVEITPDAEDNYTISVSATADNAAMFEVYFGEAEDEEPTPLMIGETVSYTYSDVGTYDVRVVALSGGAATTEMTQQVQISDPLFLPIDFESATLNYTFTNFGGGEGAGVSIVENPEPNDVNPSDMVASYTKVSNSEVWAGTTIALDEPIDFSTNRFIAVDVWSPVAGAPVIFKVENLGNPDINAEFTATTTVANEWETLIFDLNSIDPSIDYGRMVLFFNFGIPGTGETYYFDNIRTTKVELIKFPLTFESGGLTYTWNGFGGAVGAVVPNPHETGINTSSKVVKLTENNGAETWAGIAMNIDEPVDFSAGSVVKMKVWSPAAGVPVLFKLEQSGSAPDANGNPSVVAEAIAYTTTANQWEELSFDLSTFDAFSPEIDYDRAIVFYDFGNPGTGASFYFDDIKVGETEYISLFSDIADDVVVDTWRTGWSAADYEEVTFDGRLAKHYSNLNYVGVETVANQIDASEMTHFNVDFYTPNATTFRVKLVDFGPDGAFGGDDDTEHEVVYENPPLNEWVNWDIPLSRFENLINRENISQLIFSAAPAGEAEVYVSNIYFHN